MLALRAGVAARRQGDARHWRFALDLMERKHVDREDIRSRETIVDIAMSSGLDIAQFKHDLDDETTVKNVGEDHEKGVSLGVFGTPTFVFENGGAAFLKMYTPPESDCMDTFQHFVGLAGSRMYFGELKRPQPPWPRGALG